MREIMENITEITEEGDNWEEEKMGKAVDYN